MNLKYIFLSLTAFIIFSQFTACNHPASAVKMAPEPLRGIWTDVNTGKQLEFLPNGHFMLSDLSTDNEPNMGTVQYAGNQLTFTNNKKAAYCVGEKGVYSYERVGNLLYLTKIEDSCDQRAKCFQDTWVKET